VLGRPRMECPAITCDDEARTAVCCHNTPHPTYEPWCAEHAPTNGTVS